MTVKIEHDGFVGNIIGYYTTREGKRGVVLQQEGTRVVHVYGEKWINHALQPALPAVVRDAPWNFSKSFSDPFCAVCKRTFSDVKAALSQPAPCPGCDGHECNDGCQYPCVSQPTPVEAADAKALALDLAIGIIMENESGDSRAVSDEAVAIAAVSCGDFSEPVMKIIHAGLASRKVKS